MRSNMKKNKSKTKRNSAKKDSTQLGHKSHSGSAKHSESTRPHLPVPAWLRLDNAAKIYPAAKKRDWSAVFRLSATLKEPVDPEILQRAFEVTLTRFPGMSVRLRNGLFWYYLEQLPERPRIQPEHCCPCLIMTKKEMRECAIRVLYYENRISAEFFHALTDGTGGLIFLKTLVAEYLCQKYHITITSGNGVLDRHEPFSADELEDSFLKHEAPVVVSRSEPTSYRMTGTPEDKGFCNIVTGTIDADKLLALAKSKGVSLTALLAAVLVESILEIQREDTRPLQRKKPVKVLIPVNLRNFLESNTLRNFALFVTPGIDPTLGDYTFDEIVKQIHHQMGCEITTNRLRARISANVKTEKNPILKIMPLFVKNFAMKLAYEYGGEAKSCTTLSNLGVVKLPDEMYPYIERMDFILGEQSINTCNYSSITIGGKLYITSLRNIKESVLERKFFTKLRKMGVPALIESNQYSRCQ